MANLLKKFLSNCAHPKGKMGKLMLGMMNFGHGILTNWGLSYVAFQPGWHMLDIGCGGGATLKRLLKRSDNSKVYGVDISSESVAKARKLNAKLLNSRVFVEQATAAELPFADNSFDLVTAVETIYFWPDLPKCLHEVRRVMKSHAQFVIMLEVTGHDSVWTRMIDGMTAYSPEQLKQMLYDAGFVGVELYRRSPSYATIIGTKP